GQGTGQGWGRGMEHGAYHSRGAGGPADGMRRMIAAVEAWRAGWFKREHWAPNIVAGLIVGVVALPLAMAFAIASGGKPEQGLYTAIIAGAAVALFGGTRIQIAGPTGAFIVILAAAVAQFGGVG